MVSASEKLAQSLELLHRLQHANGASAVRAKDIRDLAHQYVNKGTWYGQLT